MSSRTITNTKQRSIDPTKNMTIAVLLNKLLDLMAKMKLSLRKARL